MIKVWQAIPESAAGVPGSVLSAGKEGIVVACGSGALRLIELQKAGGKRLAAAAFLAGMAITEGACLDLPS